MTCLITYTDLLVNELSRINHSQMRIRRVDLIAVASTIISDLQRQDIDPTRSPHVTILLLDASTVTSTSTSVVDNAPTLSQS